MQRTVNLLQLAGASGAVGTADSIIAKTLSDINGFTKNGLIRSRVPTSSDYNRNDLLFQPKGLSQYWTDTTRLDYNISQKHALQLVYTYYKNTSVPDITNSVVEAYPGSGIALGYRPASSRLKAATGTRPWSRSVRR